MARDYQISRLTGRCSSCGKELGPGSEFVASVLPAAAGEEFSRQDHCPPCWESRARDAAPAALAEWRSRVPQKEEKKKLFVDDEVLIQFFNRLEKEDDPARRCFRFVLALVLMRKKLLVYDRLEKLEGGRDAWRMHFRRGGLEATVIDPHMDAEGIARASQQLGEVLEGEL
jgi:hypothetical protein